VSPGRALCKAIFVITLKSNFHPILCRALSGATNEPRTCPERDSCTAKTTSAKAQKIKNSTRNRCLKKEPAPDGVAMSELSNGTKKHTSKSRETIPLTALPQYTR
jgi:hypothetical protein